MKEENRRKAEIDAIMKAVAPKEEKKEPEKESAKPQKQAKKKESK